MFVRKLKFVDHRRSDSRDDFPIGLGGHVGSSLFVRVFLLFPHDARRRRGGLKAPILNG